MRFFSAFEADGLAPPVHSKTSGQNVAFSTSSYSLFVLVLFDRFMILVGVTCKRAEVKRAD